MYKNMLLTLVARREPSVANFNMVSPAFFATLSIPLVAGREFAAADTTGQLRFVIVNERLARQNGLGGDAVGEYLTFGPGAPRMEIVGVVPDAAYSEIKGENPPTFFVPYMPSGYDNPILNLAAGSLSFYVRSSVEPETLLRVIPELVANVDPALPVTAVTTLRHYAQEQVSVDRLVTKPLTGIPRRRSIRTEPAGVLGGRQQPQGLGSRAPCRQDRRQAGGCVERERRRAVADARSAALPHGHQREGLPGVAHRTGPGARVDAEVDRRQLR